MAASISKVGRADPGEWLELARTSPGATFFHTPPWSRIGQAAGPWQDASMAMRLGDGASVVYPLLVTPGRRPTVVSSFAGCYGGPIAARDLTAAEAEAVHRAVAAAHPGPLRVTLGPFGRQDGIPRSFKASGDVTQALDLSAGFDAVLEAFSRKHRQYYRRGLRMGLAVAHATDPAAVRDYFAMYEDNVARWGTDPARVYSWPVFERMAALAEEHPGAIRLWLAHLDGQLLAGIWTFYWNDHVVTWHAASYERPGLDAYPTLYGEIIRHAAEAQYRWFDFNPAGGYEGVTEFKRRFSPQELPVLRLEHVSARHRAAERARAVARRLPLRR